MQERKGELKLAILTGDLTQRAKKTEFISAVTFMNSLPCPLFVVPGNHDVPLYNLFLRFFSPYKKFLRYIGPFAKNTFEDDDLAIYGPWTLDRFTVKEGRVSEDDLEKARKFFSKIPSHKIRIVASHHPLEKMKNVKNVLALSPHFILSGHEHQSEIRGIGPRESFPVILAAGTSTSNRTRSEANSFNLLSFENNTVHTQVFVYQDQSKSFECIHQKDFFL